VNELIKLKTSEGGKKTVSAKELYLGLELNKKNWSRWYPTNIINNEFFKQGYDWEGVLLYEEGNETWDFEISLEFAKHIAMMARTEKSHQFRNYFLMCEAKLKEQQNMIGIRLSPMELLETQFKALKEVDHKVDAVAKDFTDYKDNSPLFNIECEELQNALKRKGTQILGGKSSKAYKDKSLRTRLYSDMQREVKRQFGLHSYKALKRKQLDAALQIIENYVAPIIIQGDINLLNGQVEFAS
jgi:anti-repressor protein